jgi:hypothetical protein
MIKEKKMSFDGHLIVINSHSVVKTTNDAKQMTINESEANETY